MKKKFKIVSIGCILITIGILGISYDYDSMLTLLSFSIFVLGIGLIINRNILEKDNVK